METLQYNIDMTADSRWVFNTPGNFAKENLLYMQEVGHFISGRNYYTQREGLDSYLMKLTLSGTGILEYCGEKYSVEPGSFFLIDCAESQKYYTDPQVGNWDVLWVHFNGATAAAYFEAFSHANKGRPLGRDIDGTLEKILMALLSLGADSPSDLGRDIAVSALLTRLLAEAVASTNSTAEPKLPGFVRKAADFIREHFDETITLECLSREANVSKFHLQREFTHYLGSSPREYLHNIRLSRAKELLRGTELPIGEIAAAVGMECSYFVQFFRKNEGDAPGEYRKKWLNVPVKK